MSDGPPYALPGIGPTLPDLLCVRPRLLLVGLNPGTRSVALGHYYGRANNRFWRLLGESGLLAGHLDRPLSCDDDVLLPSFGIAITDQVKRSTPNVDDVTDAEWRDGLTRIERLASQLSPRAIAFVGLHGFRRAGHAKAKVGLQPEGLGGVPTWLLTSTSPRTTVPLPDQLAVWRALAASLSAPEPRR